MEKHPFLEAEHIALVQTVADERGWTVQHALAWMLETAASRHKALSKYAAKRQTKTSEERHGNDSGSASSGY